MHYRFTQAVQIAGQVFGLGIHQVPDKVERHAHFLKYVETGWIHEVDPAEIAPPPPKSLAAKGAELSRRLAEKHAPKPEQVQEPVRKTTEVASSGTGGDAAEQVPAPSQEAARTRKVNVEKAKSQ